MGEAKDTGVVNILWSSGFVFVSIKRLDDTRRTMMIHCLVGIKQICTRNVNLELKSTIQYIMLFYLMAVSLGSSVKSQMEVEV